MAGHPIFAALYDRVEARAERAGLGEMRSRLLARARGRVVELGAGTGANLSHYPDAVDSVTLIEPDPHMARRLRARLESERPPFAHQVVETGAESLPTPDGAADTVVCTLVMCTVADPDAVAREIARVLAADGHLLVLEHVRDPAHGRLGGWQDRLNRPWGWMAGGCNLNRDTRETLAAAGFDADGLESTRLPAAPSIVSPAVVGALPRPSPSS